MANIPELISKMATGNGVFKGDAVFALADGSFVDKDGKEVAAASPIAASAYSSFEGFAVPSEVTAEATALSAAAASGAISTHNTDAGAHANIPATQVVKTYQQSNVYTTTQFTMGYCAPNGAKVIEAGRLGFTEEMYVTAGDVITATLDGATPTSLRFVTAYINGVASISDGHSAGTAYSYTVPANVTSIVVTIYSYDADATSPSVTQTRNPTTQYCVEDNDFGKWSRTLRTMAHNEYISFPQHDIKHGEVYAFSANITSFNKIIIGRYYGSAFYTSVTVDATNVTIHDISDDHVQAHGLTITGNIQVRIEKQETNYLSRVSIVSGGNVYECTGLESVYWVGDMGSPRFQCNDSVLKDVSASYTSRYINKPIWIFGDSYVSFNDLRWINYLVADSFYVSCLINGYAGEGSANALISLKNILTVATPKYIVWCLGMNDPDGVSSVNSAWNSAYTELKSICSARGITLILATIPNAHGTTTAYLHDYKNAIIKASGYRYIDFSAAVNASATGYWITGTLAADGIHPTELGAKCLYYRVLTDFPEITSK